MIFNVTTEDKDEREVFITGNFNKWNPKDLQFQLKKNKDDSYSIDINNQLLPENIEYKYTGQQGCKQYTGS